MSIREGRDGWPEVYEYRVANHLRHIAAGEGGLLHLRLFHPLDGLLGFPPLAAAQMALDLSNAAATWNTALLDNSALPSGALVYQPKEGGNLSADQYDRLKTELDEGYSGQMRAGRPLLLEGGLDWKAMGLSPNAVALVYMLLKGKREAGSRFFSGLLCGLIFGRPAGLCIVTKLGTAGSLSGSEVTLTGSAAASLSA